MQVLQRPDWHGAPVDVCDLFVLKISRGRQATCSLRTHQAGWELRLFVGAPLELVQTQVCRSGDEVLALAEQWKARLIEKGRHDGNLDV